MLCRMNTSDPLLRRECHLTLNDNVILISHPFVLIFIVKVRGGAEPRGPRMGWRGSLLVLRGGAACCPAASVPVDSQPCAVALETLVKGRSDLSFQLLGTRGETF